MTYYTTSAKNPNQSASTSQMWITAAVVMLLAGAVIFKVQSNAAKDSLTTTLRTFPSSIRIKVNGLNVNSGRFTTTPIRLRLEEGANIIEVSRPGYSSDTVTVDTRTGDHKKLSTVKLDPRGDYAVVKFVLIGQDSVQVNVNDGFAVGKISPTQPVFEVKDLSKGTTTDIEVSEKSRASYRCKVTLAEAADKRPLVVHIDSTRNRCDIKSLKERGKL